MERMECPISQIVPMLLHHTKSTESILIGPIVVQLLKCIQAIHQCGNVVRDVKTENFMLAPGEGTNSRSFEENLASRVRLIDLAITTQFTSLYTSETNAAGFNGTPLYASLRVHGGKKCSYRDDLEALGYVVAELLIQLSSGDASKQLPWSEGHSDEEIASKKRALVENPDSIFYHELGNSKTAASFSEFLTTVRSYTFKQQPNYEELEEILRKLSVPRPTSPKASRVTLKVASNNNSPRRTSARQARNDGVTKRGRTSQTVGTQTDENKPSASKVGRWGDGSMNVKSNVEESGEAIEMDWELLNENDEPFTDKKPRARACREPTHRKERVIINERTSRRQKTITHEEVITIDDDDNEEEMPNESGRLQRRGVKVCVVLGPHKGECFELEVGATETYVIGSNPSSRVGTTLALAKDKTLDPTHVRLDLSVKRRMKPSVSVTDKSKGKTYVNASAVTSTKAFMNDTIKIGSTTLKVQAL
jgi:serine/threonine protein kinase